MGCGALVKARCWMALLDGAHARAWAGEPGCLHSSRASPQQGGPWAMAPAAGTARPRKQTEALGAPRHVCHTCKCTHLCTAGFQWCLALCSSAPITSGSTCGDEPQTP